MGAGIDPSLVERYYMLEPIQDLNFSLGIQFIVTIYFESQVKPVHFKDTVEGSSVHSKL